MARRAPKSNIAAPAEQTAGYSSPAVSQDNLRQYKQWFRTDRQHSAAWRKEAKEDFDFVAGNQWAQEDIDKLKEQMRPVVTFNRTNPIINTVSGIEISNRQEVKFYPRQLGNAQADEVLTSGVEWFRDLSNADDEDSDMFLDVVVCGLGSTETTMTFDEEPEGMPSITCCNPLEMYWDHAARQKNFTDATRRWRVRAVPLARAKAMFPDASVNDLDAAWAADDQDDKDPIDRERSRRYADQGEIDDSDDDEMITLVHLQHKEQVTVIDIKDLQTGKKITVPSAQLETLKARAQEQGMFWTFTSRKTWQVKSCFIGAKVLMEMTALVPDNFQFQFVTGFLDRNTGLPYGIMRIMKDPQRWANKWMSQAMHILNTNAKGGVMMEEDAVEDVEEFQRTWPRNDKVTMVVPGALTNGKIEPKSQPSMDASFFNMMQFAINSVPQTTGVSVELQGLRAADQPASLEAMRKQSGVDQLAPLFDNLKRYRRDQGKVMLYLLQKVIPKIDAEMGNPPRLVRVVGQDQAQYVPLAILQDVKYDIVVDDQVNTAEQKMQIWQMLTPYLQQMPPGVLLAMLDYSPFPPSVVEKIRAAAQQAMQPDPMAIQAKQTALQDQAAGVAVKTSTAQKNQAQAVKSLAEAGRAPNAQPPEPPTPPPTPLENYATFALANKDQSMAALNYAKADESRINAGLSASSMAPGARQNN